VSETTELLKALVAIDSINPDLVPGGAGEAAIAQFVADWLKRAGLEEELDEPAPGRLNVVGVARGTGGGRSLLLNAHLDTVGVAGMERPHEPVIVDHRLYGRGAYDMKGGLAAIMIVGAAARQRKLRGDLIVTGVADEEYASIGAQALVKRWRADAAIVTEPTELQVCIAHKGFHWLEVETQGVAAHGSRPDLGVDAIVKMGRLLTGLDDLSRTLASGARHPLLGTGSIHASLIRGGQELSSYPERCLLSIERRTIPGETPQQVEDQIRQIIEESRASDANFQATLRTTLTRDPSEIAEHAPIVQSLRQQASAILGRQPDLVGAHFWMDTAIFSAHGIPTVTFGAGGAGAHAVVEWVDLEQVERCAEVLLATAEQFCQ